MKKLLAIGLLIAATNVFSQTYVILSNGITLTTDSSGFVYDYNNFYLPYKVNFNGGSFFVEDGKLVTIDSKGGLYEKNFGVDKIVGHGMNYFVNGDSDLVTIDSKGFFYKFEDRKVFGKVVGFGGNFFMVKPKSRNPYTELYTINENGNYNKMNVEGLDPAEMILLGGMYFQMKNGDFYTVSKDGFVFKKQEAAGVKFKTAGGNFLITESNLIYTISQEGFLIVPTVPKTFNINKIDHVGTHYMIDTDGRMFIVTKLGSIVEVKTDHDLKNSKIISKY